MEFIKSIIYGNQPKTNSAPFDSVKTLVDKPQHLVARVIDSTSVQRTYRGLRRLNKHSKEMTTNSPSLWHPSEHLATTAYERFTTEKYRNTKRYTFGERIPTVIITLLLVVNFIGHLGFLAGGSFQAGSLLLCLASVQPFFNSIITNTYVYIVDSVLLLHKMATCSSDCLEVLLQHFILTNSVGISIAIVIGMILGAVLRDMWLRHRQHNDTIPILQEDNFPAKIIQCISHWITDYDTLRSLAIELEINVYYIDAIQTDNSRIWDVSFKVLYEWAKKQEGGLHPGSQVIAKLKAALCSPLVNKGAWVRDIEALERSS